MKITRMTIADTYALWSEQTDTHSRSVRWASLNDFMIEEMLLFPSSLIRRWVFRGARRRTVTMADKWISSLLMHCTAECLCRSSFCAEWRTVFVLVASHRNLSWHLLVRLEFNQSLSGIWTLIDRDQQHLLSSTANEGHKTDEQRAFVSRWDSKSNVAFVVSSEHELIIQIDVHRRANVEEIAYVARTSR